MKRKYISDEITKDKIKSLSNGVYLIGAEVGSGKTTFIENSVIPVAESENKKLMIVAHRKSLVRQIAKGLGFDLADKNRTFFCGQEYSRGENGTIYNDNITEYIKENVCITTYQKLENYIKKNKLNSNLFDLEQRWNPYEYDYICMDETHYIVTDAHFNLNSIHTLNYIEKKHKDNNSKLFMLTGTPKPLAYLGMDKKININILRKPNLYNHNVENIIISKKSHMDSLLFNKAKNGERCIVFVSSSSVGIELRDKMRAMGVEVGFVCADHNHNRNFIDEDVRDSIIDDKEVKVQIAILTSVMNTGVSIEASNIKNVFMMGIFSPVEIQQSVARLRLGDKQSKIILYVTNSTLQQRLAKTRDYEMTINKNDLTPLAFAERYGEYNHVKGMVNTYEGDIIHPCYLAFCKMAIDDYNELKEIGIFKMLNEMFPGATITSFIKSKFKQDLDTFLEQLEGVEEVGIEERIRCILMNLESLADVIIEIEGKPRTYNDLVKKDYKIGKSKLNKILSAIGSKYTIKSKRKMINGIQVTLWKVELAKKCNFSNN